LNRVKLLQSIQLFVFIQHKLPKLKSVVVVESSLAIRNCFFNGVEKFCKGRETL